MFEAERLAVLFGLLPAASFGSADFAGGLATRKEGVLSVIVLSQAVGFGLLLALAVMLTEPLPSAKTLL